MLQYGQARTPLVAVVVSEGRSNMLYNVLVVEDDRLTAESLAAQIRVLGHTVGTAYGPRMALQQLSQVIPDVIFMDINMPGVNGLEVVRFLRRDPATARVPVIIVSANDAQEIIQAAAEAGANHYLVKPPTLEDIEDALLRVMRQVPPPPTSSNGK
jgi:CheY-like chemotaxis protein